jgi:16S rRNA (guanine(966)-N(2))-methyltransferase RsmD
MGFEFLSNGVRSLTFVERDPKCVKLLRTNSQKLNSDTQVRIQVGQLPKILRSIAKKSKPNAFDLVFFDPPFKLTVAQFMEVTQAVLDNQLLKEGGIMVLEYKNDELAKAIEEQLSADLTILKTKKYGGCTVAFASKN